MYQAASWQLITLTTQQPKYHIADVGDNESRKGTGVRNALAQPKKVIGDIVRSVYSSSLEAKFWPHGS